MKKYLWIFGLILVQIGMVDLLSYIPTFIVPINIYGIGIKGWVIDILMLICGFYVFIVSIKEN